VSGDPQRRLFGAFAPPPPPERPLPPLPERPATVAETPVAIPEILLAEDERAPEHLDPPGASATIVHDGTSLAWLDLLGVPRTLGVVERRRLFSVHRRLASCAPFSRALLFRVIDTDAELRIEATSAVAALLEEPLASQQGSSPL